jgi:hypothetical protein
VRPALQGTRLVLESDTASLDGAPLRFATGAKDPGARKPPGLKPCHLSPLATYPLRLHSLECGTPLLVVEAYHATKFVFAPCPLQPKVWKLTQAALRATSVAAVSFGLRSMLPHLTQPPPSGPLRPVGYTGPMATDAECPCRMALHGHFALVDALGLSLEFPLLFFCKGNAPEFDCSHKCS